MNQTMIKMQRMEESEYSDLIRVSFGLSSPSYDSMATAANLEWIDPSLNDSQKQAIQFALTSREIALIHGPPGVSRSKDT